MTVTTVSTGSDPNAWWTDTGVDVTAGDILDVSAHSGTWNYATGTPGSINGQDGSDAFTNLKAIGTSDGSGYTVYGWTGLVGYIGSSPPAPHSMTSAGTLTEAEKCFPIGQEDGSGDFNTVLAHTGRLHMAMNDCAYNGDYSDNSGSVTVTYTVSSQAAPANGDIYVAGNDNTTERFIVSRWNTSGTHKASAYAISDVNNTSAGPAISMIFDAQENLYVASHYGDVFKFTKTLIRQGIWYTTPASDIIISLSISNNGHIWVFSRNGTTLYLRELDSAANVLHTYNPSGTRAYGGAIRSDGARFIYPESTQKTVKHFDVTNNNQLSDIVTITGSNFLSGIKYLDTSHFLVKQDPATSGGNFMLQYSDSGSLIHSYSATGLGFGNDGDVNMDFDPTYGLLSDRGTFRIYRATLGADGDVTQVFDTGGPFAAGTDPQAPLAVLGVQPPVLRPRSWATVY